MVDEDAATCRQTQRERETNFDQLERVKERNDWIRSRKPAHVEEYNDENADANRYVGCVIEAGKSVSPPNGPAERLVTETEEFNSFRTYVMIFNR